MTVQTTFNLGSAAKAFTALALLMLEEQRKLTLDDDVRKYVPELPGYGTPIRIRDLLQHTSGLRDYGTLDLLASDSAQTMPAFVALMARQQRLNFTPGTKHQYSHSDFVLAGLIVERIVREPFGTYLEREVLGPLGMTGSRAAGGSPTSPFRRGPARIPSAICDLCGHAEITQSCSSADDADDADSKPHRRNRYHAVIDASKRPASSSGPAGRGDSFVTRCCGTCPFDQPTDIGRGVADRLQSIGHVQLAHEPRDPVGQNRAGVVLARAGHVRAQRGSGF